MVAKYLNILAFSAVLFFACSIPVNALSIDTGLQARHANIGRALAKRATSQRCKPRTLSPNAGGTSTTTTTTTTPYYSPTPTTSSTQPASTPASSSGGGGKACLGFSVWDNVETILKNFKTNQVWCIYNWTPNLVPGAQALGYVDIPMLWGTRDLGTWSEVVAGYSNIAFGFNEPDDPNQGNLDPTYAATLWQQYMLPLRAKGYTLVSPATTSSPNGITWMKTFLSACGAGCVDGLAAHWYGIDAQDFIQYIQNWHQTFNLPIYVTEFACMDFVNFVPCPNVYDFATTVKNFMDGASYVMAYAPYAIVYDMGNVNPVNQLLDSNLGPTSLAQIYFG